MGINGSTQFYENLYSDAFAASTEVLQEFITKNAGKARSRQTINLVVGSGAVLDCGKGKLEVTQKAKVSAETMTLVTTESAVEMANSIISRSTSNVNQTLEQTNEKLNLGQINIGATTQKIHNDLRTNLTNRLANTVMTLAEVDASSDQVINVNITGGSIVRAGGGCLFEQDTTVYAMAQTLSHTVMEAILKSEGLREFASAASMQTKQVNEGITTPWEAMRDALIAILVVGALALVVFLAVTFRRRGSKPAVEGANEQTSVRVTELD